MHQTRPLSSVPTALLIKRTGGKEKEETPLLQFPGMMRFPNRKGRLFDREGCQSILTVFLAPIVHPEGAVG